MSRVKRHKYQLQCDRGGGGYIRHWVVAVRQIEGGWVRGGGVVGDTMFTSYSSGCHGRQAASLLVLILQHPHGAVAMVTSSREREREGGGGMKEREREKEMVDEGE